MKKLTAPEKRKAIREFYAGASIAALAFANDVSENAIEEAIRQEFIQREKAGKR